MKLVDRETRSSSATDVDPNANPLVAQLTHLPFPELATVLRGESDQITRAWDATVRQAMPQMQHLTFDELKDSTPQILAAIADALASDNPDEIRELVNRAPAQGRSRFLLNFDVLDVMQEDRLLRAIIVQHVEAGLDRQMAVPESAALHATIDIMLQRSVIAHVDEQKVKLQAAAETELKFLSYLSHDLNGKLNGVNLWLQVLAGDLKGKEEYAETVETLTLARESIEETVAGMRRMLEHERLRNTDEVPSLSPVDIQALATRATGVFGLEVKAKGLKLAVAIPLGTVLDSNAELISVVLQNLIGNAVKYSSRGTVRIGYDVGHRMISVSDEGPGIAAEKLGLIFAAFRRGEVHGQIGVGLGLAIASQAAKLLNAELTVESTLGVGSTFRLAFPVSPHGSGGA